MIVLLDNLQLGRVVRSWVKITQGQCENWTQIWEPKKQIQFILIAYNLMIGYSKKNIENYPRECFWWKETACEQALCLGKGEKNPEVHRLEKKRSPG